MVPVTAITMMNAVIASPVQRWSHKILSRNMSCLSGIGVRFDVNETCGKVTGGFATPGSAGRKAKPTHLKTAEFSTRSMRTSTLVSPFVKKLSAAHLRPSGLQARLQRKHGV